MSKLYLSAAELAAMQLPHLPKSRQGVEMRAKNEQWSFKTATSSGRNGGTRKYALESLPADIQAAVREQQAVKVLADTAPAPMPVLPGTEIKTTAMALTERQRQTESARMGVLHAIENIMAQAGVSKETAIKTVLTNARMPEFAHLARLFEMARDERGASGDLPGVRTIKRWFSARDTHSLAPKIKQADMRIPDWAPLYLRFYQTPQAVSHRDAYEQFARTFMQQHPLGKLPSPWQCYRFVQKLGNVSRHKGRIGERELKNLKPYKVRDFLHLEPTEIYTCDGHTFDAEVMHPDSGKPYRPEITTIADVATRKIVGFSVDVAESGTAVLAATQAYIDDVRPVTAKNSFVIAPDVTRVDIRVAVKLSGVTLAAATADIEAALAEYFTAIQPGDSVIASQLEAVISDVTGVTDRKMTAPAGNLEADTVNKIEWFMPGTVTVETLS